MRLQSCCVCLLLFRCWADNSAVLARLVVPVRSNGCRSNVTFNQVRARLPSFFIILYPPPAEVSYLALYTSRFMRDMVTIPSMIVVRHPERHLRQGKRQLCVCCVFLFFLDFHLGGWMDWWIWARNKCKEARGGLYGPLSSIAYASLINDLLSVFALPWLICFFPNGHTIEVYEHSSSVGRA